MDEKMRFFFECLDSNLKNDIDPREALLSTVEEYAVVYFSKKEKDSETEDTK